MEYISQTTTVTAEEDWEYEFENMPVYSDGEEIIYTIDAVGVEGYSGSVYGYDIIFQHTPETHAISGSITWDDNDDQDGKRPASVSVKLYANGSKKKDITITAKDDWKYTVSDLPKYENGKEIKYTVAADKIEGYTLVVNGYNITASHTPEILDLSKATVKLSASSYTYTGTAKKPTVESVKLKVGNKTKTLTKGTDYTVSYQNNTNIGTATVTITGKGNYNGTATKTFTIKVKKGTTFMVGANKYKITSSSQVAFTGLKSTKTTKVTIPKTVKIGSKSFQVTAVADKALYEKTKVTSVNIGANVKTIGTSAFEGCKKLSKVTIGSNVTKIGNKAFKSCTALKSITVPDKVTTIGKEAFRGCSKLSSITINSTKLTSVGKNALKGIKSTAKIKVPAKKLKAYKTLLNGKGQGSKVKITN